MCSRNPPRLCPQSHTVLVMVYNWPSVGRFCVGKQDHLLPETCYLKSAAKHNTTNQLISHKPCSLQIIDFEKQIQGVRERGNRNHVNCESGIVICMCVCVCMYICVQNNLSQAGCIHCMNPLLRQRPGIELFRHTAQSLCPALGTSCGHHTSDDLQV